MENQIETGTAVQRHAIGPVGFGPATLRWVCIRYSGHHFIASLEMAGAFLRRAQQLIDDGDAQLVPLLHRDGIEILYVATETPISVHDATEVNRQAKRLVEPIDGSPSIAITLTRDDVAGLTNQEIVGI
jgi:hypothetical protein